MNDAQRIKEKLDIVDVVSEYVSLKKAGQNFKALSPFRTEKTPSFIVSSQRQIFRDFGGEKGGDVISFIMEIENIDFPEALKFLAEKAGITLSQSPYTTKEEKKKESIYQANHLAQQFYEYLLQNHSVGKKAKEYALKTRKIPPALAKKFGIGYAPRGNTLTKYLTQKKGYTEKNLIDSGLSAQRYQKTVDFFQNRLIFPIFDVRGNIVAFSGRALENDPSIPKYINTRETPIYKKRESLFGIFQAKEKIRQEKKAILVEGELDVISSFREGISNIVAVKGTALTQEQIKLLGRYADKILFCFDQDPAGTDAQRRSIELIEKQGLLAAVVQLESGKDPDELLNTNPAAFKKAIKKDTNIYEFLITSSLKKYNSSSVEGKKSILEETLPILSKVENEVIKEHYYKFLAEKLNTSQESIVRQAEKILSKTYKRNASEEKPRKSSSEFVSEQYALSLITQARDSKKAIETASSILNDLKLSSHALEKIYSFLKKHAQEGKPFNVQSLSKALPEELLETFDTLHMQQLPSFESEEMYIKDIENTSKIVKHKIVKKQLKSISELINQETDEKNLDKLNEKYDKLTQMLK